MNTVQIIESMKKQWKINFENMAKKSVGFHKLGSGTLSLKEYQQILRQIYHNTRYVPQIMAMTPFYLKGSQLDIFKSLLRHSIAEHGHEQLAKNDIEALGFDVTNIATENPSPATLALTGALIRYIQHVSPIGLLGYMFHLEYTPVMMGNMYMEKLKSIGVPQEAMTFIEEHAAVDVGHVKLMDEYIECLVKTPEDMEHVLYMMRVTSELYGRMIDSAIEAASEESKVGEERVPSPVRGSEAAEVFIQF